MKVNDEKFLYRESMLDLEFEEDFVMFYGFLSKLDENVDVFFEGILL